MTTKKKVGIISLWLFLLVGSISWMAYSFMHSPQYDKLQDRRAFKVLKETSHFIEKDRSDFLSYDAAAKSFIDVYKDKKWNEWRVHDQGLYLDFSTKAGAIMKHHNQLVAQYNQKMMEHPVYLYKDFAAIELGVDEVLPKEYRFMKEN